MMAQASASGGVLLLLVGVGTLLVGIATLVVGTLTLRSAREAVGLAEGRMRYLSEERERLDHLHQERRALADELERERQERRALAEQLERDREERLEAQQRAQEATREAQREAAARLRGRLDGYLKELQEQDTSPNSMRRVK
jgi:uncharacterized protein (DUF3084 family)